LPSFLSRVGTASAANDNVALKRNVHFCPLSFRGAILPEVYRPHCCQFQGSSSSSPRGQRYILHLAAPSEGNPRRRCRCRGLSSALPPRWRGILLIAAGAEVYPPRYRRFRGSSSSPSRPHSSILRLAAPPPPCRPVRGSPPSCRPASTLPPRQRDTLLIAATAEIYPPPR
jgi:hypothetical protein